ncbi:SDR family oxidoreductase [Demequina capsici]|uniref:SDR family oxidoreductase n=1 Tax=Demequina capsici TaxID=3075620 RepID=A0AA96FD99_9MICO|nr:SDR family oxidoreductase [Demequina sp. PMTSA13]WNM27295.1 SDR family oxidoreductase [Demequina sp. PMTSA13]
MGQLSASSRVAIVGGAGKIGRLLVDRLVEQGTAAVPLARRDVQLEALAVAGGDPRRLDIEHAGVDDFVAAFEGCDAVVFTAGGGADGNAGRKQTVDLGGSLKSIAAAELSGIRRFVQVSAIGVDAPADASRGEAWVAYVEAKREADSALRASGLAWTILRPGRLTDDAPTGLVELGPDVGPGAIPRDDVAALIAACIADPATALHQWEVVGGTTSIEDAIVAHAHR